MTFGNFQMTVANESTYGTPAARTRAFEFESEGIEEDEGRTSGDPLRSGTQFERNDRFTPYFAGAAGDVDITVLTKGFGFWLPHMLGGSVATTGPAETSVYTHTALDSSDGLVGKSFCLQVNRPFNPSGTDQPFLYGGGKLTKWALANSVDSNLVATLSMDFANVDTTTALDSSPAYPSSTGADLSPLSWAGGLIQVGGVNYDITEISIEVDNGLDTGRRQIRRNTQKKEPVGGRRVGSFTIQADFESMTQRNRAHAAIRANALATLTAVWNGPVILGTTLFPSLILSIGALRFDSWKANVGSADPLTQELKGAILYPGSGASIGLQYQTADSTP